MKSNLAWVANGAKKIHRVSLKASIGGRSPTPYFGFGIDGLFENRVS
ncbi:MAG: hypothetical protein ACPG4A_09185 [Pseudomonadales bacterium]